MNISIIGYIITVIITPTVSPWWDMRSLLMGNLNFEKIQGQKWEILQLKSVYHFFFEK